MHLYPIAVTSKILTPFAIFAYLPAGSPKIGAEFQVPVLVADIGWLHRRNLIQAQLKVPSQLPLAGATYA